MEQPKQSDTWIRVRRAGLRLLKLFGVVLTTILAAGLLTVEWDGYQREAELRAALVSDVSTSLARASMSARFAATGAYGVQEEKIGTSVGRIKQRYNEGKRAWEEDSARIRAQLQAYYENPRLATAWETYAAIVSEFFQLSYPLPSKKDAARLKRNLKSRGLWVQHIRQHLDDMSQNTGRVLANHSEQTKQ
jgi:hypothetical protein